MGPISDGAKSACPRGGLSIRSIALPCPHSPPPFLFLFFFSLSSVEIEFHSNRLEFLKTQFQVSLASFLIPIDKSRHARRLDETMTTMERSRRGSGSSCHLKHKERDREIHRKQNIQALVCISKQLLFLLTCEAEAIANCNGAPATELQECSTTNNSIIIVKQTQTGPKKTQ